MSKIYFVPDVHLQEYSPRSRKDSYPTTILEKLEYIVNVVMFWIQKEMMR